MGEVYYLFRVEERMVCACRSADSLSPLTPLYVATAAVVTAFGFSAAVFIDVAAAPFVTSLLVASRYLSLHVAFGPVSLMFDMRLSATYKPVCCSVSCMSGPLRTLRWLAWRREA